MTGVLETAAVGAVIATASTSLAAAGYGHARGGRTKLLTDAMSSAETGPLSQLPMNSLKGPLKAQNVALSINYRPSMKVSVQFNGEILSITKGDGTADPCMALGGTNVVVEGTKVTATATNVSSSASLTFDSKDEAAKWGKEMTEASRMCDHAHRIQELIDCVCKLESYMNKDLRPRAAMCKTREVEIKALERKLKKYEEEQEPQKEKEGGREETSNEGSQRELALNCEERGDELDCSPYNVKKLMDELQAAKLDSPGAVDDNNDVPQLIVERLNSAEAKKMEVDALVNQLMGRIDLLGSDGTDFNDGFTSKNAALQAEALSLQGKLSTMVLPPSADKREHQKLEDIALGLEKRLMEIEKTKDQLSNHYKLNETAEDLEGRLASLELASRNAEAEVTVKEKAVVDELIGDRSKIQQELSEKTAELSRRLETIETSTHVYCAELSQRLETMETNTPAIAGQAVDDELIGDRSKIQQELSETAAALSARLATIETNTPRVNGEGVAPQVVERQLPQIEYVDRIEYVEKLIPGEIEYIEKIVQVPGEIQYIEKVVEKFVEQADAERPANWVSAESHAALQAECEAYMKAVEAGVSLQDHEALMQQHMTLRQQFADQQEEAQLRAADMETQSRSIQELQDQAATKDRDFQQAEAASVFKQVSSARTDELAAALNEVNAQLAAVHNAKVILERDLEAKHGLLEEHINRGIVLEQNLQEADAREVENRQQSDQFDQEFRAVIAEKERDIEALRAQGASNNAGEEVLTEMRSMNDSLQRQLNNMEVLKENAENQAAQQDQDLQQAAIKLQEDARRLAESQQHMELMTQEYNKVVGENEILKIEASGVSSQAALEAEYSRQSAALEQQVLAERQGHVQEIKAMEDKQAMLTKEFEAEYADIRRKQSQTLKQYEEEAQRADIEARAKIQLMEEKQALLAELEQLRLQGLQQGAKSRELENSAASSTQLQQRLQLVQAEAEAKNRDCIRAEAARQSAENQLGEANDREQQLSLKLRLFAEREQQLTLQEQALNRQNEGERANQASVAQRLNAAEVKAAEYYQQVMQFSAENEQLKAEQGYLVSKVSEAPRKDSADMSGIVTKLSGENSDLKNQLAATWAKINEQTKKIEEERLAFWEELEAVRLKADMAPPVNSSPGNVSVPFDTQSARMPSTVQAASSPLTTGFGQSRAGVQRQQPATVSGVSRNEAMRPVRASGSGAAPGSAPVPTRTGGISATQPRSAFSPQLSSTGRPGGVPLGSGIGGGLRHDGYSQPITTGQVAPSRR